MIENYSEWRQNELTLFQEKLGYLFSDLKNLEEALTHSSYSNEVGLLYSNERLEFLGDAVLELSVSYFLFKCHPEMSEGELTRMRSSLVCNNSLAAWSRELGISELLRLGKGLARQVTTQGIDSIESILADAQEALFGAIFYDGGFSDSQDAVQKYLDFALENKFEGICSDPKTLLQIKAQQRGLGHPVYNIVSITGLSHEPHFLVKVSVGGAELSEGEGNSRKDAEFRAAESGLEVFEQHFPVDIE